jgi:hypothetical protein
MGTLARTGALRLSTAGGLQYTRAPMTTLPAYVVALLLTAHGAEQRGNPYIDAASDLYATQRFAQAREQLVVALQVPGLADDDLERALDLLARCHVAEGRRAEAERTYARLLAANPHWEPQASASPKIRDPYDAAKQGLFRRDHVELRVSGRSAEEVRVELIDPWGRTASLAIRRPRSGLPPPEEVLPRTRFATVPLRAPGAADDSPWEVVAISAAGDELARVGSDLRPEPAPTPAPAAATTAGLADARGPEESPASPRIGRWHAWLLTGLAVASLSLATGLEAQAQGTSDRARASPWAGETRALNGQARTEATWAIGLFGLGAAAGAGAAIAFLW